MPGTLLTDEDLAWVGRQIEFEGDEITEAMVRQFVAATDDPHPSYLPVGQPGVREGGPVVPPMLYYGSTRPFVCLAGYADDGTLEQQRPMVGTGQAMGGSLSVEWLRPLRVGDRLRGLRTLSSLEEKHGTQRTFALATWDTAYTDEKGEVVVRERYEQILF